MRGGGAAGRLAAAEARCGATRRVGLNNTINNGNKDGFLYVSYTSENTFG